MKTISTILTFLLLINVLPVFSQDKNPVAENDFDSVKMMQTKEILVLKNDFAYDGHPFRVAMVYGGSFGTVHRTDSSIVFTPGVFTESRLVTDTLRYTIIDLENNLLSAVAKIFIEITNDGFEKLDVNRVSCRINSYGLQFWSTGDNQAVKYEVPAGSGVSSIFSLSLWIAGLDGQNNLHVAAERYRMAGPDFFSGPVMDSASYSNDLDIAWHKVWKLSAEEIAYHIQHWQDNGYVPVENIAKWPGNGDTALGQAEKLAPYFDRDEDGNYDPMHGDVPLIKGDQAIFVLNNDDRGIHGETEGKNLGVEIQTLYYAYNDPDSALSYTTFADQYIINRSDNTFHDLYVGHFLDFDLGYFADDYIHCDTTLESAICYNGTPVDGSGNPGQYGEHPPAQSFTCLNYQMGGFVYFQNWNASPPMQDPSIDREYYNYLRGFWLDSTHITYGGTGHGGTTPCNYTYTGDPVAGTDWTEANCQNAPGDRRGLISSGPYSINPGDTIHLEYALVWARDFSGDNLPSVALLKERIMDVREFYQNSLDIPEQKKGEYIVSIYPNPCNTNIYITLPMDFDNNECDYTISDLAGKKLRQGMLNPGGSSSIYTGDLTPGFYFIKIEGSNFSVSTKFVRNKY